MTDKIPDQAVQAADKAVEQAKHAADSVKREVRAHGGVGGSAVSAVQQADRFILRLNKLLASPGGLSAFLSTSNYILYVLAYLQPRASPLYTRLLSALKLSASPGTLPDPTAVHPVAALAQLLSKCRTTLRLLGTLPLYAWLRSLSAGPKPGSDAVLHRIAAAQAGSYFAYQVLENICVLADNGVVPPSFVARLNKGEPTTGRLYTTAYRFWLVGVSCDFLRLAREARNISQQRAARSSEEKGAVEVQKEDRDVDRRWWMDAVIAAAWFPMALHFSAVTGGVPGWHIGWMGVSGLIAGGERMRGLWAATA